MRAIIQRVSEASVSINAVVSGSITKGLLVFIGMEDADNEDDIEWLCQKIVQLRIFPDASGKMNLSVKEIDGNILVVSQFTLHASTKKGNRPSFIKAARPEIAVPLYNAFCNALSSALGKTVEQGVFGEDMKVRLLNDGPVTISIDTKNRE